MKLQHKSIILIGILLLPIACFAQNLPCSGKKGGIARCEGSRFVCNDGSYSKSKISCSGKFGNESTAPSTTHHEDVQLISSENESHQPQNNTETTFNLPAASIEKSGNLLKLAYEGFTVWIDCKKHGAMKFQYNAQHDTGNEARAKNFKFDPNVPKECQQTSTKGYGQGYDRGHEVPANHLDYSPVAIKQSNYMTNILPQTSQMNRGAWLLTEEIIECYRDIDELLVIGGVIWGNNPADDYFINSHGVKTPDAFWKVIIRGSGQDERAIAWIVPNSMDATKKNLDRYLISIDDLERITGEKIPVADYAKHDKPSISWLIPKGCNKA